MKLFYILLNILFFILAVLLFAMNLTFKHHQPDMILSMSPDLSKAVPPSGREKVREDITDVAVLWENNLFSPYRTGDGAPMLGGTKPTGLELIGVGIFGDNAGAIILDKQPAAGLPLPGRSRMQGGAAQQPAFYKLGDTLSNGFMLTKVGSKSVTLSRGREEIVLDIDFNDEGTSSRGEVPMQQPSSAIIITSPAQEAAQPGVPDSTGGTSVSTTSMQPVPGAAAGVVVPKVDSRFSGVRGGGSVSADGTVQPQPAEQRQPRWRGAPQPVRPDEP